MRPVQIRTCRRLAEFSVRRVQKPVHLRGALINITICPDCSPPRLALSARIFRLHIGRLLPLRTSVIPASSSQFPIQITHHGRHQSIIFQLMPFLQIKCQDRHDAIAIYFLAVLINQDEAIGIAIKSDSQIRMRFTHSLLKSLGVQCAALVVNIQSIRSCCKFYD